jgi:hypothetical protein
LQGCVAEKVPLKVSVVRRVARALPEVSLVPAP